MESIAGAAADTHDQARRPVAQDLQNEGPSYEPGAVRCLPTENKELLWLEGRNREPVDCTRQRGEDHVPRQMLELRNDADRAVLAAIVESIVGIPAATTGANLGKPRPHLSRSGMDGDGVRQRADRVRDQLIAGETSCRLIGDCFDRTRKTPEREHPDHQSSRTDS